MTDPLPVPTARPWVDWTARQIADPLLRLRFLRTAAPVWQPALVPVGKVRRAIWLKLALLAVPLSLVAGGLTLAVRKMKPPNHVTQAPTPLPVIVPDGLAPILIGLAPDIWQVEKSAASESYSNGLQIDNRFSTANHPRSYLAFPAGTSGNGAGAPGNDPGEARTSPAGIVYHTTESLQAPFEAGRNGELKKVGENLLGYVKRRKAYNFVIDRFGRVFRVVLEADAAEHAGYSVWSDEQSLYVNLNESFIGVAVETRTEAGQLQASVTAAQVRAIAMLTEMLRNRYRIPAGNCVTHAQVSVSPSRMLAGYHMDWASSFPFEEVGLPNNYARPLPSVAAFGFEFDASYSRSAGARLLEGAGLGERELAQQAAAAGMALPVYRKLRQKQYRQRLAATRGGAGASHEGD